jgi:hypothetical protein|tara:strand:+ start:1312 stop:1599 length:288 start_codon:yes stop_codon:yes gene_type:complete
MTMVLQQTRSDIPPRAFLIVTEKIQVVMATEIAGGPIENLFFLVCDKYFTRAENQGLLDFYETGIGKNLSKFCLNLAKNLCKLDKFFLGEGRHWS